jgi:hypothetical protein
MRNLLLILTLLVPTIAFADIGQIKTVTGEVRIERAGAMLDASAGDRLEKSDILVTGADGQVGVTFVDNTRLSLGPGSRMELSQFRFDEATHEGEFFGKMHKGTLSIISGQIAKSGPDAMKVQTPTSVLSVRGTRFLVKVD